MAIKLVKTDEGWIASSDGENIALVTREDDGYAVWGDEGAEPVKRGLTTQEAVRGAVVELMESVSGTNEESVEITDATMTVLAKLPERPTVVFEIDGDALYALEALTNGATSRRRLAAGAKASDETLREAWRDVYRRQGWAVGDSTEISS